MYSAHSTDGPPEELTQLLMLITFLDLPSGNGIEGRAPGIPILFRSMTFITLAILIFHIFHNSSLVLEPPGTTYSTTMFPSKPQCTTFFNCPVEDYVSAILPLAR